MRHGNYHIDHEAGEPDPHVIDLNAELGQCDDFIATTLPKKEQQCVLYPSCLTIVCLTCF